MELLESTINIDLVKSIIYNILPMYIAYGLVLMSVLIFLTYGIAKVYNLIITIMKS